MSNEESDMLL